MGVVVLTRSVQLTLMPNASFITDTRVSVREYTIFILEHSLILLKVLVLFFLVVELQFSSYNSRLSDLFILVLQDDKASCIMCFWKSINHCIQLCQKLM